ncbi:sperm-associated antigen 5 isoform X2 [Nothobranchius furzeri]|uniref:Transcript variant X2 n=1 Tax=Nothobranchius furzeri TaxID=105023 RepID=A0A9D2YMK1_NOTFU|nr:sperm-associated antigen 5 isoform X2 [Nothobranchius furzeri]KAF7223591.1 transcript variant X2 [Nothobranchius furzeri]
MSGSSREGLSSSRYGERTPLRILNNEILKTPSWRLQSKSQLSGDTEKMTMVGLPLCDLEPHLQSSFSKMTQTSSPPTGLGDMTFKSFVCAGGEVEVAGSSVCVEEDTTVHLHAAACSSESEDPVMSQSVADQSCSDHVEHPYYNRNVDETLSGVNAVCGWDTPTSTLTFEDVENRKDVQVFQACQADFICKSLVCDGGEVEVSEDPKLQEETIPLPLMNFSCLSQLNSTYSANCSDSCSQSRQKEHTDHPYCFIKTHICSTFSATTTEMESADGQSGLTGAGGEIKNSEGVELADETIPLPVSRCYTVEPSVTGGDENLQNDHIDNPKALCGNISTNQQSVDSNSEAVGAELMRFATLERQDLTSERCIVSPSAGDENLGDNQVLETPSHLHPDQDGNHPPIDDAVLASLSQNHSEPADNSLTDLPGDSRPSLINTSLKAEDEDTVKHQVQNSCTKHPGDDALPSVILRTVNLQPSQFASSAESPVHQDVQQILRYVSLVCSGSKSPESCQEQDGALGSSAKDAVPCTSTAKPPEVLPDVLKVLSECPSVASVLQLGILSPIVKRASLNVFKGNANTPQNRFVSNDSVFEAEKSLMAPVNVDLAGLLTEHLESPMPRPLLNSTTVGSNRQPALAADQDADPGKMSEGGQRIPESQLQQQLRQMAEFLLLASGQIGAVVASAPPPAGPAAQPHTVTPAAPFSVCVGTSPVKVMDRSLSTSGIFVQQSKFPVTDSCAETDPLVWNFPVGSLEALPKEELEQRLMSSMIMVEALVQQLAAARAHRPPPAGPAPSDLREKLVQTDHTELSQTSMFRDLYTEALDRISQLELDGSSLQNLIHSMQNIRVSMSSLSGDVDAALSNMKECREVVIEDHHSLASHYRHMASLFEKSKEMQTRMMLKVKDALHEREVMRNQMEEAFAAKEAAFSVTEQLRRHCASEISALERSVGSQQELLAALNQTYPEQIKLKKACGEILNSASNLLSQTTDDHSTLMKDLCAVRSLLQKTAPVLLRLKEKAAAALRERDEHLSAREQAIEERQQAEEELKEADLNLQTARQQISDLNLQVTILSSEMGVLRQKLTEKEEATSQLERQVTEMSATISSTMASYTFLEQALDAEVTKLQQSRKDAQQANERGNRLKASLEESEQHVCELSQTLAQSQDQVHQLQTLSQSQSVQIQQLQDICAKLKGVQEMNEFLQMENELAREQVVESERLLSANLQALRERNFECEDLKGEVCKLQAEKRSLHEELETTRSAADTVQMELEEKMAQVVTEVTLTHHTLRRLTDELHAALSDQKRDPPRGRATELLNSVEHRHPSTSFVDSIKVALTDKEEDVQTEPSAAPDVPDPEGENVFSETSAFTRIAVQTPKKDLAAVEADEEEEEESSVSELLSGLNSTIAELVSTLKLVQQHKDARLQELHNTICSLQGEQHQILQQRAQDEKILSKLMVDVQEAQEIVTKHKTDNSELRKELVELRCALQLERVESQCLRDELRKAGGRSANSAVHMEEKIQLLREVERLKTDLQDVEQARVKLLERAKRHQTIHQTNMLKNEKEIQVLNNVIQTVRETLQSIPEVVKGCEALQQLTESIG